MTKQYLSFFHLLLCGTVLCSVGCTTMNKATEKTGEYIGAGVSAAGGVTRGMADGYQNQTTKNKDNPYNR